MSLSNDLISQFVKATKDSNKTSSETTVFGTTVEHDGKMYVKLDGSDLLTPVYKTTDVKADERVTVMIKNHTATITGNMTSPAARTDDVKEIGSEIETLVVDKVVITEKLEATEAEIKRLDAEKISVDELDAKYVTTDKLEATDAYIKNLVAEYGEFKNLTTGKLTAIDANISNLDVDKLDASIADIKYAKIEDLEATNAHITNLKADVADIDTLIFGSATGTVIQSSFANAVIAQLGNAQIKSAMIDHIAADKIDAGTLNTNNIRVVSEDGRLLIADETIQISDESRVRVQIGKDASGDYSINVWDANGKLMFSEGGITDSAIKDAIIRNDMISDDANISGGKIDISSLFKELNDSTETLSASRIYLDADKQTLDVSFTQMSTDVDELSNDVSSQGTALSVVQGQISSKIWQQDIDTVANGINGSIENLTTKHSSMEQTIDGIIASVGEHESAISKKADSTEVEAVKNRMTTVEVALDGISATITENESDINNVNNKVTNIEATVNGLSATVSNHNTQIANKADKSTVTTVSNKVSELEIDVDGFKTTVSSTYATKTALNTTNSNVTDVTNRMTSAESSIAQHTKDIALRVTTSELETTLNGYSTEAETNAAIEAKASEINLSVNDKITNIEIGGRNLLRWTEKLPIVSVPSGVDNVDEIQKSGISKFNESYGTLTPTTDGIKFTFASNVNCAVSIPLVYDGCIQNGEEVTLSFDYRGNITDPGHLCFMQRTTPHVTVSLNNYATLTSSTTEWKHYEVTFSSATTNIRTVHQIALFYNRSAHTSSNWIEIKAGSLKLEQGNKATDWSPAPEDMATSDDIESISNTIRNVSETMSSLAMTAGSINAKVESLKTTTDAALDSVNDSIESLSKSVSAMITEDDVRFEIESAMSNGTSKVVTSTGFKFDEVGLSIEKSGSEMKTQITEDGMTVYQNDAEVLVANNTGVDAKNLRATTYLIVGGRSRFENYGDNRTGCFWIGG